MKDLKRLAVFGSGTLAVILLLIALSRMELPSGVVVFSAIMLVVVLPVILAIKLSQKERENRHKKS